MNAACDASLEYRVLILGDTSPDFDAIPALLQLARIPARTCASVPEMCHEFKRGAGALVLTQQAIQADRARDLRGMLDTQPAWSDVPLVLVGSEQTDGRVHQWAWEVLGNILFLAQPVCPPTFLSAMRAALRARQRQYENRGHLLEHVGIEQQLTALNDTLEQRVRQRTAVAERRAEQLRKLAAELTNAEQRERRRLAQTLHDHLQQLLVAVKLHLGMMRDKRGLSAASLQHVGQLVDESIEASRSLTLELSPPILYDAGLAAALDWLARWMSKQHGLLVQVDLDHRNQPIDEEVRVLIFQAVRELLFNVVKHAAVQNASVTMRFVDGLLQVVVSDQGAGYEPTKSELQRGLETGFGLFSIRERVEVMGGQLEIQSAVGRGTDVTLSIAPQQPVTSCRVPIRTVRNSSVSTLQPAKKYRTRKQSATGKIRVLLADDHDILRQGLASLLHEEEDLEVVGEASDGQMAVDLAIHSRPDVVIMDVTMPNMDGIEATRRIVSELPGVHIIGLSMHEKEEMALAMREAGADAYLRKDGPSGVLIDTIRTFAPAGASS